MLSSGLGTGFPILAIICFGAWAICAWANKRQGNYEPSTTLVLWLLAITLVLLIGGMSFLNLETQYFVFEGFLLSYLFYRVTAAKKYVCVFQKKIYRKNEKEDDWPETTLRREIILPFIPFQGLSISSPKETFFSGRIRNIHFNKVKKEFVCEVEPHTMSDKDILEEVIPAYIDAGWEK